MSSRSRAISIIGFIVAACAISQSVFGLSAMPLPLRFAKIQVIIERTRLHSVNHKSAQDFDGRTCGRTPIVGKARLLAVDALARLFDERKPIVDRKSTR